MKKQLIVKYGVVLLVFVGILCVFKFLGDKLKNKNIEAFKNGEVLVCHKTLIVSNENWKLNQDHLINNNLAGYVHVENCEIQK